MPYFAANLTLMYPELPFLDRYAAARADGFRAVEYLFPYEHPKARLAELLGEHGLTQALHNFPPGDFAAGERGLACLPGREQEFQDGVGQALDYARALGCRRLNCLAGIPPAEADPDRVRRAFVENFQTAARAAAAVGIDVLLEAINQRDIPGYYVSTTAHALELLDEVGAANARYQYDFYHMQIMEGDLAPTVERHLPRIAHVQIADTPGRHEPGTGEINYPFLFDRLDALGYTGWVGCEYRPRAGTSDGLGWFAPYRAGQVERPS